MTDTSVHFGFSVLMCALPLVAAIWLSLRSLARPYWALIVWFAWDAAVNGVPLFTGTPSWEFYGVTRAVTWVIWSILTLQAVSRGLRHFPAIGRFSQKVVVIGILAGCAVAMIGAEQDVSGRVHISAFATVAEVGDRGVATALAVTMLIVVAYLAWLPLPLPPNVLRHSLVLFLLLLVTSMTMLVWNRTGDRESWAIFELTSRASGAVAAIAWAALLRSSGEAAPVLGKAPTVDSAAILRQLDAINQSLARN